MFGNRHFIDETTTLFEERAECCLGTPTVINIRVWTILKSILVVFFPSGHSDMSKVSACFLHRVCSTPLKGKVNTIGAPRDWRIWGCLPGSTLRLRLGQRLHGNWSLLWSSNGTGGFGSWFGGTFGSTSHYRIPHHGYRCTAVSWSQDHAVTII